MKVAPQFVLLVIVLLVLAAVSLLPRRQEHVAMLADEGRHKEVIELLERQLTKGLSDPDLLAALGRSYAALGEYHRAVDAFDAYLAVRPDDRAARERQAELLLQNGLVDRYLDALARMVAAHPSPSRVTRLIELYRLHGRVEDELSTLRAYAASAMLEPSQLERLGAILAERANWREARQWLELADQIAPPDASTERLLLLDVLIQSNEIDQAYRRAQVWMTTWRSPYLAGKLILRMAQSGLAAPASELALKYGEMMPEHIFEMADLLARNGRRELARQMLAQWADRTTNPTGQQLRAFVYASVVMGDAQGPLLKLAQLMRSGAEPATQGQLAEELANAFGKAALVSIRPLLSNEALLTRPLFAAELSLYEGNRETARWFLNRADPARLSPEQRATWLALLRRVETDADVFNRLAALWNDGRLPAELLPLFADEALKLGQVRMHDSIWNSMRRN
jgi:tetratricopeptide (TPR) repeat protein